MPGIYMKTEKRLLKIPVMMMTAEQDPKLSSDSFSAGAVVFLPKPFTTGTAAHHVTDVNRQSPWLIRKRNVRCQN